MYFQDLTPYEYLKGRPSAVNVGWLDSAHPFVRGSVPDGFAARLRSLERQPANQTRGFHVCQFCDFGPVVANSDQIALSARLQHWQEAKALSSAEIRVFGRDGTVYAAPMLIRHYVEVHGYQPPKEFVEAVMEMDDPATRNS